MIKRFLEWMCDYNFPVIPINRRAAIHNALDEAGANSYELDAVLNGDSAIAFLAMQEYKAVMLPELEALITPTPKWQTKVGLFFAKGAHGCECCLGWRILAALLMGVAVGLLL